MLVSIYSVGEFVCLHSTAYFMYSAGSSTSVAPVIVIIKIIMCLKCEGYNIRGSRQESRDVSGSPNTRDHVQVRKNVVIYFI